MTDKETLVMDPIHDFINISEYPVTKQLIESKYFQRLRRLAQLGLTSAVYPNATHTRFAHCIGVMHVFLVLFDSITRRDSSIVDKDHKRMTGAVTALLHDLGHGPFSHASESILDDGKFDHLKMTCEIITETEIKDILNSNGIEPQLVKDLLNHEVKREWLLISQLISSQLDADRLDYLVRDSYFSGVDYGKADVNRIANTLEIWHGNDKDPFNDTAVVNSKGISAIENYIVGRNLMYKRVYFHKISRCMELLLGKAFKRASELKDDETHLSRVVDISSKTTPESLYKMDDNTCTSLFQEWTASNDDILRDLSTRILERRRLPSISIPSQEYLKMDFGKQQDVTKAIAKSKHSNPDYYLIKDTPIKSPYDDYNPEELEDGTFSPTEHIMIPIADDKLQEVSRLSPVIDVLSKTEIEEVRLFVPEDVLQEVKQIVIS